MVVLSLHMLIVLASLNPFQEVANIAEWDDEQIEYIKERVTEEGKQADLKKGKEPAQVCNNICMLKAWVMDLLRVLSRKSKMIGKLKERAYLVHLFLHFSFLSFFSLHRSIDKFTIQTQPNQFNVSDVFRLYLAPVFFLTFLLKISKK